MVWFLIKGFMFWVEIAVIKILLKSLREISFCDLDIISNVDLITKTKSLKVNELKGV